MQVESQYSQNQAYDQFHSSLAFSALTFKGGRIASLHVLMLLKNDNVKKRNHPLSKPFKPKKGHGTLSIDSAKT